MTSWTPPFFYFNHSRLLFLLVSVLRAHPAILHAAALVVRHGFSRRESGPQLSRSDHGRWRRTCAMSRTLCQAKLIRSPANSRGEQTHQSIYCIGPRSVRSVFWSDHHVHEPLYAIQPGIVVKNHTTRSTPNLFRNSTLQWSRKTKEGCRTVFNFSPRGRVW